MGLVWRRFRGRRLLVGSLRIVEVEPTAILWTGVCKVDGALPILNGSRMTMNIRRTLGRKMTALA
jgi:hypothetical protein